MRVIVLGAGAVGAASALWLKRDGHHVTLIDKTGPAAETSFGNAGLIAAASTGGAQHPGAVSAALRSLAFGGPFFLDWRRLPRLAPWLLRFARNCAAAPSERMARAMSGLCFDAIEQHRAIAAGTPAARFIGDGIWLHLFKTAAPTDSWSYRFGRELGYAIRPLTRDDLAGLDPHLNPAYQSAWAIERTGRISDPGAYVAALADAFRGLGGELRIATAASVRPLEDGVEVTLAAPGETLRADRVVIAAGVWSETFARALGLRTGIVAERGYHVEYWNSDRRPPDGVTYYDAQSSHVAHGMDGRLRVTSISEPAAIDSPPNPRAQAYVRQGAIKFYPRLRYGRVSEWMGRRPSTTDGMPLIGASRRAPNILFACGHQHLGLTLGPRTGRLIADVIGGRSPNLDMAPFDPDRFS